MSVGTPTDNVHGHHEMHEIHEKPVKILPIAEKTRLASQISK